jgi:hypothetical protein
MVRQRLVRASRRRKAAVAAAVTAMLGFSTGWSPTPAMAQAAQPSTDRAVAAAPVDTVDLRITRREVVAGGHRFGDAGAYEKLVGTMTVEVDPRDRRNAVIVDLDKAPRNARGMVEYDTDFYLLKPVEAARWNGKLFFEVNNRGNKTMPSIILGASVAGAVANDPSAVEDFGTGYLLRQGYAIAWSGWEGDVLPGANRMTIRLPVPHEADGRPITQRIVVEFHDRYFASDGSTTCLPLSGSRDFASYPAVRSEPAQLRVRPSDSPRPPAPWVPPGTEVPADRWRLTSDTEICVDGGFRPGDVYELTYTARDPRVMGLGYAATRDVVSFLRNASTDRNGDANPLAIRSGVTAVLGHGASSSGMYMRDYLYQGFNEDVAGRQVFDGVNIHIPGAHKLFLNYRFSQPNPFSVQHRDRYMPYVNFPFNYGVRRDPVSGRTDGILKRPATDPLVTHTDSSTEYWQFQAALVNTDGFGRDVRMPASVRQFLLSGTQHGPNAPSTLGNCQQLTNPTDYSPALRAQIHILDEWVVSGTRPPDSRAPSVAAGTLVPTNRSATRFPAIPGVTYNGLYNDAGERDYGPREQGNRGIIDNWHNPRILADYRVLVPRVNRVGIDRGGLELPVVGVPNATLTGWNLRRAPHTAGDLCDLSGMRIPLPDTEAEAQLTGDSRPSLEELYPNPGDYERALRAHAARLVADRLLMAEDAPSGQ